MESCPNKSRTRFGKRANKQVSTRQIGFEVNASDDLTFFAVTGGCECTSLLGPALGGGHGFLQGHHGLIADQFVSLNMMLANGSLINVREDSDLWWTVKGAGHKFGIVTSVTSKIYDVPNGGLWSYQSFFFTHDKVEDVYEAINEHLLEQPVDLVNYSVFFNEPNIDPDHVNLCYWGHFYSIRPANVS